MKYVDNLLEVNPKEISHECNKVASIQTIIKPDNAVNREFAVVVVFTDGIAHSYTIDGRPTLASAQRFIFKPKKVKRLKPLHVVLAEADEYKAHKTGWISITNARTGIVNSMLPYFGTTNIPDDYYWDEKWIEEVDEESEVK